MSTTLATTTTITVTTTTSTTPGISGTTTTSSTNTNANANSSTNTLTPPQFPANLAKFVNIIESNVKDTEPSGQVVSSTSAGIHTATPTAATVTTSTSSGHNTPRHYVPKTPQIDEIVFTEPTFMERFARYFVVVIYLCGLCSVGFVLSIYHFFFWDSRMPPVYKGQKKPAFG